MTARLRSAGFSLVEVLCAILVLGVGLAGLTRGLTTALISSKESEVETTAALLAAGRVELLRADGYVTDGVDEGEGEGSLSHYHWQQTVARTQVEGLHSVTVVVQKGSSGKPIYQLETLLFDPPVSLDSDTSKSKDKDKDKDRKRDRRSR